ncbi:hypothetical protein IMZ48_16265 [Candidatus Bathyarchaeota archaeon]|nr:hypothetical protein [Candidatus Bathyarchaeota archaeon]
MQYSMRPLPGVLLDGPVLVTVEDAALTLQEMLYNAKDAWVDDTVTAVGDVVVPSEDNGYAYIAKEIDDDPGDAKTGAVEPTWPTTVGETVVDDCVTWECSLRGMLNPRLKVLTLIPVDGGTIYWEHGTASAESPVFPTSGAEIECSTADILERTFFASDVGMQVIQGA